MNEPKGSAILRVFNHKEWALGGVSSKLAPVLKEPRSPHSVHLVVPVTAVVSGLQSQTPFSRRQSSL